MRCTYRYVEGDGPVVKGENKVGDQCSSQQGSPQHNGMCGGHYNQWRSVHDRESLAEDAAKRSATIQKKQEEAKETRNNIVKDAGEQPEKYGINASVIEAMGLDQPCVLENELALYKALNLGEGQDNYDEKMALARWLSTPEPKRNPKTTAEAAKILGCSVQTLELWRRSPEMAVFRARNAEAILQNAFSLVAYKVLEGVDRLDPRYIKLFNEMRKDIIDKSPKSNFPQLKQDLVDMANRRQSSEGREQLREGMKVVERSAVFSAVRDGDVEAK